MRKLGLLLPLALLAAPTSADAATRVVVRGAGFGHGIGMSQYGAYGLSLKGYGYRDILARYYTGTQLAVLDSQPEVRVLLQGGRRRLRVSGVARVGDRALSPARTYTVGATGGNLVLRRGRRKVVTSTPPMRLEAPAGAAFLLGGYSVPGVTDGRYRGALELRPGASGGVNAINALGLEDYVRGVVSAESPAAWPADALRAQAVAARTYAITSRAGSASAGFDQWADTRSQVYRGVAAERPTTDAAVSATSLQVVTYGGQPVTTFFFSTSGGHTENIENSFVGAQPRPWLRGVEDPFDDVAPKHRWGPIDLTLKQVQARLSGLVKGRFRRIQVIQRGASPRIVWADIVGSRGRTRVTGPTLRARFGLNDTWAYFTTVTTRPKPPTDPDAPAPAADPGQGADPTAGAVARAATVQAPRVSGRIAPARPGAWLRVERRRASGRWRVAVDTRVGADGRYSVAVPRPGLYRVVYRKVVGPRVPVR